MNKQNKLIYGTPLLLAAIFLVAVSPITFDDVPTEQFGGMFTIIHADANGNVLSVQKVHNLVTNEGMECMGDLIFNGTAVCTTEQEMSYIALGTNAAAPADGDTALGTEAGCARVQDGTVALNTGVTGQRTATVSSQFSGGSCEAIAFVETGIFDASSTGNMLARATFGSITLGVGETLTINYDIVINNA